MAGDEKFPIWELWVAQVSGWEIDESRNQPSTQKFVDSVELTRLQPLVVVVLDQAREVGMLFGSSFRHYRLIRGAITAVAWMGSVTFRVINHMVKLIPELLIIQDICT